MKVVLSISLRKVNIILLRILPLLLIILLISCQTSKISIKQNQHENSDSTFCFTLDGMTDFINSKDGVFTRQYMAGPKTVNFQLTEAEILKIRSAYLTFNLDTLPDRYYPKCLISVMPSFPVEVVVVFNGKKKEFTYNGGLNCEDLKIKATIDNMGEFTRVIYQTIKKKKGIRNLKNCDIRFE